jgi:uncharacterized membrane protein YidH (DUF202 family)
MLVALAGVLTVGFGTVMLGNVVSSPWSIETTPSHLAQFVGGGFICIIGLVIIGAALNVLDDLGSIVENIWDRFLEALGR